MRLFRLWLWRILKRSVPCSELTCAAHVQAVQSAQVETATANEQAAAAKSEAQATRTELSAAQASLTQAAADLQAAKAAHAELATKLADETQALVERTAERDELRARAEREEATTRKLQQATEGLQKSSEEQRRGDVAMLALAQGRLAEEQARVTQLRQEKDEALAGADALRRDFNSRDREVRFPVVFRAAQSHAFDAGLWMEGRAAHAGGVLAA